MSSFRHLQTAPLGAFIDKYASRLSSFLNYLRLIRRAVTANNILALSSSLNYVHLIRPLNMQIQTNTIVICLCQKHLLNFFCTLLISWRSMFFHA